VLYGSIMALAASQHRVAPEGYAPEGYTPPPEEAAAAKQYVHIDTALRTPQVTAPRHRAMAPWRRAMAPWR
jgi:hypothetical protein